MKEEVLVPFLFYRIQANKLICQSRLACGLCYLLLKVDTSLTGRRMTSDEIQIDVT